MTPVRALVLTGFGLNCDYETQYALGLAGAEAERVHINELILDEPDRGLERFHMLVLGGGFSWADDHGAGILLASKLRFNLEERLERFIGQGKLVMGICNGFQALVSLGLLPGFNGNYNERLLALIHNDSGNFIDAWVRLKFNPDSPCIFTKGLTHMELPVRHGEGKLFASENHIAELFRNQQVAAQYADEEGNQAKGRWPLNPNGSLGDIAGICDPTGRIFGLMPHPEAFHHYANHPNWTFQKVVLAREGIDIRTMEGDGVRIFRNAVEYVRNAVESGVLPA